MSTIDDQENPGAEVEETTEATEVSAEKHGKYTQLINDAVAHRLTGMYKDWFLDYASYVILERAVPHLDDGLKPVQRRILHSMKRMDDGRYNKVANIIGFTMQFHPHGDASIGDALVQLGQKDLLVDTHIVPGNFSLKLTPKNLGAKGIKVPKCSVSVAPSFGDDTGHALTLTFSILNGDAGYWYSKFLHRGDLELNKYKVELTNSDTSSSPSESITVTTDEDVVTAVSNASWCVVEVTSKTVKIGAKANSGEERTASVTVTAGSQKAMITVTQAGTGA